MQDIEIINRWDKIYWKLFHVSYEKLVVFVHGFTGDMHGPDNLFELLRQELVKNWYSVFQFNFRWTFPSEMSFEKMTLETESQDLDKVLTSMKQRGYNNISLVWESMGVSVILSRSWFEQMKSLIFWYWAYNFIETSFKDYLSPENRACIDTNLSLKVEEWFSIWKQFFDNIEKIQLLDRARSISCPVLFLHGNKDIECNYRDSLKAYELVPHDKKDVYIIWGEEHCFRTSQEKVIKLTLQFFKQYF